MFTCNDSQWRILSILYITNSANPLSDVYKCKWFETHSAENNWNGTFGAFCSRAFTSQHSFLCSDTEDSIWSAINVFTPFAIVPISTALYRPCHYPTVQPWAKLWFTMQLIIPLRLRVGKRRRSWMLDVKRSALLALCKAFLIQE